MYQKLFKSTYFYRVIQKITYGRIGEVVCFRFSE